MNDEKYREYLQSEKWHRIAQTRIKIDGYCCCMCGSRGTANNPLEVHHITYHHLYHEEDWIYEDLLTVCHVCHKALHKCMERITNPNGRRGWKDARIPQIHVYDLGGSIRYKEGIINDTE